jgi:hypothetical protein
LLNAAAAKPVASLDKTIVLPFSAVRSACGAAENTVCVSAATRQGCPQLIGDLIAPQHEDARRHRGAPVYELDAARGRGARPHPDFYSTQFA